MSDVLVLADLHLDLWMQQNRDPFDGLEVENARLFIIAGDLANEAKTNWKPALELIGQRIELGRVHIIPGNHDYYGSRLDDDDLLADIARETGAHLAQKCVIIHEHTRYISATLWTDFALGPGSVEEKSTRGAWVMNDYRRIGTARREYLRARPADTIAKHREHLDWLRGKLARPFDGETVVVTHHAPHPAALPPDAPLPWCHASDLTALIEEYQPDRWLFGHTHHAAEFQVGRTQLKNVSVGNPIEGRKSGKQLAMNSQQAFSKTDRKTFDGGPACEFTTEMSQSNEIYLKDQPQNGAQTVLTEAGETRANQRRYEPLLRRSSAQAPIPGPTRMLMIDTTPFAGAIAEIPLDGNTLITGQNAAGKTSVIQLMPLFLGVPPSKISDKTQGKDFFRYYLPRASSYIAFEYQHRDGYPRSVIIHSALSDDKLVFRFVRSALYEDMFVTESGDFVSSDNLASHLRNCSYSVASQQVDTILDYRTIILGLKVDHGDTKRRKFLAQMITEYTISQLNKPLRNADQVIYAMLTRDISLKAIENMLADKLLAGDPDLQVEGDRSNIENWPVQYHSYCQVMEHEPKARELEAQSKELIGETSRRTAAIREMLRLTHSLAETERQTDKKKSTAEAKLREEQAFFSDEARKAKEACDQAQNKLKSTNNEIEDIEKRYARLVEKDAEAKVRLADRKDEIEEDLREAQGRYNALDGEQRALTAHYDRLKSDAERNGDERINGLHEADAELRKEAEGKIQSAEVRHTKQEQEVVASFVPSMEEADSKVDMASTELGAAHEAGRNPAPRQDLLDRHDAAGAALEEINALYFSQIDKQRRLEGVAQHAKDNRQKANQRLENLVARITDLTKKLSGLEAARRPAPGSLLAFLREHREDWGETVGKVIKPELLSKMDLSPDMVEEASSLFGLRIDLDRLVPCDESDLSNINAAIDQARAEIEEETAEKVKREKELRTLTQALRDAEHAITLKETEIATIKRQRDAANQTLTARKEDVNKARMTAKQVAQERIEKADAALGEARTARGELIKKRDEAIAAMRAHHREEIAQISTQLRQDIDKNDRKRRDIRDEVADRKYALDKELKAALAAKGIDTALLEKIQVLISAATSGLQEIRANEHLVAEWRYVTRDVLPLLPELRSRSELEAQELDRLEASRSAIVNKWHKREDELSAQIAALQATLMQCEKDQKRIAQRLGAVDPNEIAAIAPAKTTVRTLDELINDLNDADRAVRKLSDTLRQGVLQIARVFQHEPQSPAAQHLATAKEEFSSTYEGPEWVPTFIEWYDKLHVQQRAQLLHDASIVGNSIKSGYQRLMTLEQQIQSENRTLQSHLNDNNFMAVVEDLRVSITSSIQKLEFMPAMKRLSDLHEAWISQPHDTDPPEGYSEAMTELLRFWNARNGISANLRDQIRIEGHIIEKGNRRNFNSRTDMKNLSSNGVSYLIMTTIMVAFVNIVRGRSPVRFIWALDELSNIDEGNTRKLLEMLDRNQINLIAATPSAMGNVNALFDYRVKLLNNGQLADVRGAGRKSQRLLPCPATRSQEM